MSFATLIAASSLAQHEQRLRALLRPACDIVRAELRPGIGQSRFGGVPDRTPGSSWPRHRLGPYRFLGQINFGELPGHVPGLPASGVLSLFYAYDEDGECSWGEEGYIHAEYYAADAELVPHVPPEEVRLGGTVGVSLRPTLDLPFDEYQMAGWELTDNQRHAYDALRESLHDSREYLLGYPSHCTLAYDPTPGPDWLPLITLASDEELEWFWHDGDKLMVFAERARLERGDFSVLRADAG